MDEASGFGATTSSSMFRNFPLISAFVAFALAQSIKFFTTWFVFHFSLSLSPISTNLMLSLDPNKLRKTIDNNLNFITRYKERRWDPKQLVGSGGMPSSHSATVTALAAAVGFQDGFGGPLFATALVLACIVMYDATGVRMQAGRQAEVLNQIVYELPAEHPLAESRPLRELLGHTPPQVVAGGILGLVTAVMGRLITMAW
ncbi:hypothetical protein Ahy_B10g101603 isoform B [Arachis hypogaea]|uniref:Uncharacterized protein n=1 Tax=Arachis hypogaea TaxID=3818 RepID=A0A444X049_ARAHY|nr:hypothetical protein Ahy_B10g101603 isoform B [Arachis hypogaea]